jgi:capsular polysaccharide biosynthesis protein
MFWRRLLNEAEIVETLIGLGFEVVYLENMSLDEQIELFQQAEWIVGPHGSAFLNIIFASVDANILVLSQPNLFNWGAFQGPMEVLGYRPLCVCAEYATDRDRKHSDYRVSSERVVGALEFMGLRPRIPSV